MSFLSHKSTARSEMEKEIRRLSAALESLKKDAAKESEHRFDSLRHKLESLFEDAHLDERGARVAETTREASEAARECVRSHPMTSVVVAAGAFALIGFLLTRR
ncbi:DUF883 family protein [Stutzerimonas tarimensis]|uniref:YqjD family protein n=1 Tax=Stutzerimonas tarimensis TaxID=1507735 RepID=A0ABV7T628_9GAMM